MDNKPIGRTRDTKSVSWYSSLSPDSENHFVEDDEFSEASNERHPRSSSFTVRRNVPTISDALPAETRQILEGTLNMRRNVTRFFMLNTRLIESVPVGDTAYMSRIIVMGANPNATCRLIHVSACHLAAMYDNGALELLLALGAESLRSDKLGRTPLHLAAWAGHFKHIALLLNFPEALVKDTATVMASASIEEVKRLSVTVHPITNVPCQLNASSIIPEIWSDGMEHNCRHVKEAMPLFESGWTALHAASARAQYSSVQLLLAAGAEVGAQDILCRSPLDVAGSAHYMGYKIEVFNLKETVRLLLKAGSKFHSRPTSDGNTPLHTAVELESEELVEELLRGGASATVWNSRGLTAMHIAVEKKSKELLRLLVNYEYCVNDADVGTVNARNLAGHTVLGAAIREGWLQGVCIALGARASVTMKGCEGDTALHIAAQLGNVDILQEIINVSKLISIIDLRNEKDETALFRAISYNQLNALKMLLSAGAGIEKKMQYRVNVFHIAAKHGNTEILDYLLEYDSHVTARIINEADSKYWTPLVYAISNNHPECVKRLIIKGAEVNIKVRCNDSIDKDFVITMTPLHVAASGNYCEIATMIIQRDGTTIHAVNSMGRTPLHEACRLGNREMIALLLHNGADLSGVVNRESKRRLPPIDLLMNNVLKPTDFMQEIFDSCISSQGRSLQESNCEVTVQYKVLVPNEFDLKQMSVIKALINTGNRFDQSRLLLHPLVQSFLYLKWKALLPFFYTILSLHIFFVLSLNVYAVSVFYYKDKQKDVPMVLKSNVWKVFVHVTVSLVTIQEIIFINIKNKQYLLCLETWMKLFAVAFAVILPKVVFYESDWARLIATFALMFSWFEMMFLLSRLPDWGFYVLMFGKVAGKVFKILLSFAFLIFGFSICFMIQFKDEFPFDGPWAAFVKTMVMMTTEFDYQTIINKDVCEKLPESTVIILRIIFLIFLILVPIVLMNLLVGVAVNDVNNLEMIGNIKRLEKQIEFITSLEDIVSAMRKLFPRSLYKRWSANKKWKNEIVLRPRETTCIFPSRIRQAIFERAQLQMKQSEKQLDSLMLKMKLNEIHNATVKRDDAKENQSDCPGDWMVKIVEEIEAIRNNMEFIKNCVVINRRRTISGNNSSFL